MDRGRNKIDKANHKCPRCGGYLIIDGSGVTCLNCGHDGELPVRVNKASVKKVPAWLSGQTHGELEEMVLEGLDLVKTLTNREEEVLELLSNGCMNAEIGERLGCHLNTIEQHVTKIYAKLGIKRKDIDRRIVAARIYLIATQAVLQG